MDDTNITPLAATEAALAAAAEALEAAQAARAGEADRIAAARLELEELGKQLRSAHPESKEFAATMRSRAACRDRLEVFEARLAAAQGTVDEAAAVHAAALDARDREKLPALQRELEAAEDGILEWFSREVEKQFADKMEALSAVAEEARRLDLALGKRAGRGPGMPLVGNVRVRWLTPDANPFAALRAWRTAKRLEARRKADLQATAEKNYSEALELHARLSAEEDQRQRARERFQHGLVGRQSSPRGVIVSDISLEKENQG